MRLGIATLALCLGAAALADGTPPAVVVQAIDADGAPVSSAVVVVAAEGTRHRVNTYTGEWTGNTMEVDETVAFARGMELELWVSAPGYEPISVKHTMTGRSRGDLVRVELQRASGPPTLGCLGEVPLSDARAVDAATRKWRRAGDERACFEEARAWAAFVRWADLEDGIARHAEDRPEGLVKAAERERARALSQVQAWRSWAVEAGVASETAESLCVVLAGSPAGC